MTEDELNEALEQAKKIASGQVTDGMVIRRTVRLLLVAIADLKKPAKVRIVDVMDGGGP